jgi:2-amino-4-hydroxy-6-hydroxymethyldihydropteridine diphosphokinase
MLDTRNAPVNVYLSAGSNIAPGYFLRMACAALEKTYGELTLSSVYRNPAVGFTGSDFLNMVIGFSTRETPELIVARLETLHHRAGRRRQANPYCSRTLDLDLLMYGDVVRPQMKLPHGDIEKYGFVLCPLAEIAPDLRHPVVGQTMRDLWTSFAPVAQPMTRVDMVISENPAQPGYQPILRPPSTVMICPVT